MNYYPFHLGDYAAHTAHLEPMEDLAYRRMLDLYYRTEKALPEPAEIARLIRMRDHAATIRDVLNEFFTKSDDGWHNKRADAELTSMTAKQEQQATKDEHEAERMRRYRERRAELFAALRVVGVVPAWDVPMKELQRIHDENCNGPATDLQRVQVVLVNAPATAIPTPTPTPTPTPVENPPTPRKRGKPAEPAGFDEFWAAYPRRVARGAAVKAWAKLAPDEALQARIASAIERAIDGPEWRKDGGAFVPHPATWLNAQRWLDEPVRIVSASPTVEIWTPPPPPTAAERAASEEARRRVMSAVRVVSR